VSTGLEKGGRRLEWEESERRAIALECATRLAQGQQIARGTLDGWALQVAKKFDNYIRTGRTE
jgi:predicted NBD/HSP70 family sugar kinase